MTYLRGIAIGLGFYALCWGLIYAGGALADSDYLGTALALFWAAYFVFAGIVISKNMGHRA